MHQRTNDVAGEPVPSVREFLTALATEVDQQIVHVLGGEFLDGSGFEHVVPEASFGCEGESNGEETPTIKRDLRQEVTDSIVEMLEKDTGEVIGVSA